MDRSKYDFQKTGKWLFVLLLLVVFTVGVSGADWISAGVSLPAELSSLGTASQGRLFALTGNGLYLSSNEGATWNLLKQGLNPVGTAPTKFAATAADVFIPISFADSSGGVYRFNLANSTWTRGYLGLPLDNGVRSLAFSGNAILAGTNQGVYASRDFGNTWTSVNQGIPVGTYVTLIHVLGSTVFIATNLGTSLRGVPAGAGWAWTDNLIRYPYSMAALGRFFFSASIESLKRSSDSGQTWTLKVKGMDLDSMGFASDGMPDQVAVAANQVFALRTYMSATVPYSEIWRSTDSGESWTNYSVGLPKTSRVSSLASDGNRLYAAYYGGQVWKNTPEPVAIRPVVPSLRQLPRRLDPREGFTIPSHPGRSRYSHIGRRLPAKQGRAQPSQ